MGISTTTSTVWSAKLWRTTPTGRRDGREPSFDWRFSKRTACVTLSMPGNITDGLLVRRSTIPAQNQEPPDQPTDKKDSLPVTLPTVDPNGRRTEPAEQDRSKYSLAHDDVDAERAGLKVARIMDGLLVELTREKGSTVRMSIEIEGTAREGQCPPDVVETVKANACDLKVDQHQSRFEGE